ncbi:MAG: hypothetical protein GWP56_10530 [Gammaproteobacteria bacterium]|nr:hypothetical protein [Gammaproteobacteria bacterium]
MKKIAPDIHNLLLEQAFAASKPDIRALPIYRKMRMPADFLESRRAFAEKREPVWQGK